MSNSAENSTEPAVNGRRSIRRIDRQFDKVGADLTDSALDLSCSARAATRAAVENCVSALDSRDEQVAKHANRMTKH
jgi:hypothetical protein